MITRADFLELARRLRYPTRLVAVAIGYLGAAKLGLLAAVAQKVVSSAWPPSGVALAALLLLGLRYWPGIAMGAFLLNWTASVPVAGAAGIALGNTLEAVSAVWLLRRVADFRPSLDRFRDVVALVTLGALASTTVSATIGIASLGASGVVGRDALSQLWVGWWSGDALGDVLVAPLLLTWARATRPAGRWPEAAGRLGVLVESVRDHAIVRLDPSGRVVSWNVGAQHIKGYTAQEIMGRSFACFYTPEDAAAGKPAQNLREAAQRGRCEVQGWRVRKDGAPIWAQVTVSALPSEQGEPRLFVGVIEDITERRGAQEQLHRHREQLRDLAARLEAAREAERTRIAREIHDELGQALTALKIDLTWLRRRLPQPAPELAGKVDGMEAILDGTAGAIQRIATELRPGVLDELGLQAAIQWQAREFETRTGIACRVEVGAAHSAVDATRATAAFRIFQEALTNVARHAGASSVLVRITLSAQALELSVQDNGRGISDGALSDSRSLGLLGIRERATNLGGTVTITAASGRGTLLTLSLPSLE